MAQGRIWRGDCFVVTAQEMAPGDGEGNAARVFQSMGACVMISDRSSLSEEMAPIFDQASPCLKWPVFQQFLQVELRRAERYRNFVSLLFLRLGEADCGGSGDRLTPRCAEFVRSRLRSTDYLSCLDRSTLAVVILNSKEESTEGVLQRLRSDLSLYLQAHRADSQVSASASVFPTEAASLKSLCSTALERLGPVG